MPNVMGREFPYTPQGMAAAQQYSQAMGMRDGGPMGFRPLGMQAGGDVNRQVYGAFEQALTSLPMDQLAKYIYDNLPSLKSMAEENPARAAQLRSAMEKSGFEGYMRNLMQGQEQSGNLGRIEGQRLSDRDVGDLMPLQEQMSPMPYSPGDYERLMPMPDQMLPPLYDSRPGDYERLMPMPDQMPDQMPPMDQMPDQMPEVIEVANGGYLSRRMNRGGYLPSRMNNGGLMSLRRR